VADVASGCSGPPTSDRRPAGVRTFMACAYSRATEEPVSQQAWQCPTSDVHMRPRILGLSRVLPRYAATTIWSCLIYATQQRRLYAAMCLFRDTCRFSVAPIFDRPDLEVVISIFVARPVGGQLKNLATNPCMRMLSTGRAFTCSKYHLALLINDVSLWGP
jgi:hypothetical protein